MRSLLLVAIAVTLSSCLITQQTHFDEPPNSPPAIYESATGVTFPIGTVIQIPQQLTTLPDAGTTTTPTLMMAVDVYDPDVDQTLPWRVFVDSTLNVVGDLGPMSSQPRRHLPFNVTSPVLSPTGTSQCHRIDLFVSGGFDDSGHHPRETNDIDQATWWVAVGPDAVTVVDMRTCQPLMTQ